MATAPRLSNGLGKATDGECYDDYGSADEKGDGGSGSESDCSDAGFDFDSEAEFEESLSLRERPSGSPLQAIPLSSTCELSKGDHILYQVSEEPYRATYRSALVLRRAKKKNHIKLITNGEDGVKKVNMRSDLFLRLYKIDYSKCRFSGSEAVKRAKWRLSLKESRYHALLNNSHFFASWAKTGKEHSLRVIIEGLEYDEGKQQPLDPVFQKVPLVCLSDLQPGDHIMVGSDHLLVERTYLDRECYMAYSLSRLKLVQFEERKWVPQVAFRIVYEHDNDSISPDKCLQKAASEFKLETKWNASEEFVTFMKTGKKYIFDDRCLLSDSLDPISCTPITPLTAIDEGDHLLVKTSTGLFHSVLVIRCIDTSTIVTMPDLNYCCKQIYGEANLSFYRDVYRVNYNEALPPSVVLNRARSSEGEKLLHACMDDPSQFVTWSKIGRQFPIDGSELLRRPTQLQLNRPLSYIKLLSTDEIEIGDHLFVDYKAYRWHFMVTGKVEDMKYKTIYCFRTAIKETIEVLDPEKDSIYKVLYSEEDTPEIAIKRARTRLGSRDMNPLARMEFVRWAKTKSTEGLEVSFLINRSMPSSKSQVFCFTQLNPGDYLVKTEKFEPNHHYLVESVLSPSKCCVFENRTKKTEQCCISWQDGGKYYRINYDDNVCRPSERVIERALGLSGKRSIISRINRQNFVNLVKTGEYQDVDVGSLADDRILLCREKIDSACQLKPGDHIEHPISYIPGKLAYHHMMVVKVLDDHTCQVIHFAKVTTTAGDRMMVNLVERDLSQVRGGEVWRMNYLERVSPRDSLTMLQEICQDQNHPMNSTRGRDYHPFHNNCEHVIMMATVGHPVSLQVDERLHKTLVYQTNAALKPIGIAVCDSTIRATSKAVVKTVVKTAVVVQGGLQAAAEVGGAAGVRTAARAAFRLGFRAALSGTTVGAVAGIAAGVNVLIETPLLGRQLYKLHRQKKFNMVSDADYKRGVVQESFKSVNMALGATAGAIIGQVAIPVPVLGAAVGGFVGGLVGRGAGAAEGWAASKLVRYKPISLPVIVHYEFVNIEID